MFDAAIGRPATLLVVCVVFLVGVLLTFNITLRELLTSMAAGAYQVRLALWESMQHSSEKTSNRMGSGKDRQTVYVLSDDEALAFEAPPQSDNPSDDIILTPIAARRTRSSLFRRGQEPAPPATPEKPAAPQKRPPPALPDGLLPESATQQGKPEKAKTTSKQAASAEDEKPGKDASKEAGKEKAAAQADDAAAQLVQEPLAGFDMPAVYQAWPMPSLDMLDFSSEGGISDDERRQRARLIEDTLASFKVEASVVGVNTGPAVTQFELQPAVGVKISKITSLEKDLALSLAAPSIRIEAPIPGKAVVGIEIPNSAISVVNLRDVMDSEEFEASKGKLKLPLGKDVSGIPVVADMARMPHLLVAGSTGSGKSVAINAFLCGLLLKHTPEELKLILVDPKMVELIVYNRVPHLLSPVVTELERVVPTLKWATREMERRYKVFARHGCRNLDSYKQLAQRRADLEPMPYILIVIDELADLMMMAPDEIETYICRLAQMARATGIHLIIATQRPSVDVITGLIKANFPSRIAFAVTSQTDSRVILDTPGADHLLGRGDMLYMAADAAKLVRIQGTYVSDREVERIVSFWRKAKPPEQQEAPPPPPTQQPGTRQQPQQPAQQPAADEENTQQQQAASEQQHPAEEAPANPAALLYTPPGEFLSGDEQDELMPQALELVRQHKRASASLLQRRLRIGYSKAAQLIDLLEEQGVVGPAEGGRSREVLNREE
jgi:S-DNA-T family DNA segregation ATPase FtsK/SpoIIIE